MFETVYSPIFVDNPTFCCTLSLRVAIGIPYLLEAALYVSFLFLISAIARSKLSSLYFSRCLRFILEIFVINCLSNAAKKTRIIICSKLNIVNLKYEQGVRFSKIWQKHY